MREAWCSVRLLIAVAGSEPGCCGGPLAVRPSGGLRVGLHRSALGRCSGGRATGERGTKKWSNGRKSVRTNFRHFRTSGGSRDKEWAKALSLGLTSIRRRFPRDCGGCLNDHFFPIPTFCHQFIIFVPPATQ
jgi:hypothetical protein